MNESNEIVMQADEVNKMGFLNTSNIEVKTLPSKGLAYPHDATISVRPYSFGEIKRLAESTLSLYDKLLTIASGVNTNFSKNSLTFSDVIYLGVIRKLNTLGTTKAIYPFTCPKCKTENKHIFDHSDLETDDIEASELPISAVMSDGKTYEFMPLNFNDAKAISEGSYNKLIGGSMLKNKTAFNALLCKSVPFEQSYLFFNSTTDSIDHEILEEIDSLLAHDIKPLTGECSQCKTKIRLPLKNAVDMVLPFREQEESIRSRISFGKGTELSRD
jgi:hypothetical protein